MSVKRMLMITLIDKLLTFCPGEAPSATLSNILENWKNDKQTNLIESESDGWWKGSEWIRGLGLTH